MSIPPLRQGRDYYIENGYWVFTAEYLLSRGYCCGSGCRHCPYPKTEAAEEKKEEKGVDFQEKSHLEEKTAIF